MAEVTGVIASQEATASISVVDSDLINAVGGSTGQLAEQVHNQSLELCAGEIDQASCGMKCSISADRMTGGAAVRFSCGEVFCSSTTNCGDAAGTVTRSIEEARTAAHKLLFPGSLPEVSVDIRY